MAVLAHKHFLGFSPTFGLFGNGIDTVAYRHGAGTILTAEPLYEFALFEAGLPFTYPPFAAIAFTWLEPEQPYRDLRTHSSAVAIRDSNRYQK